MVRVEQATGEAADYTMEVVHQRGAESVIWSGATHLPAHTAHAVGEIPYPCAEEGSFEYAIKDADGRPSISCVPPIIPAHVQQIKWRILPRAFKDWNNSKGSYGGQGQIYKIPKSKSPSISNKSSAMI